MAYMIGNKEIYKGFEIAEVRHRADGQIFSRVVLVEAVLKPNKAKGRLSNVIFRGKIREIKKQIREYWESK